MRPGANPKDDVPSALDDMRSPPARTPLIDLDDIVSGRPAPDGIPAIDEPGFRLADTEAVRSLTVGGKTGGHPYRPRPGTRSSTIPVSGVPVAGVLGDTVPCNVPPELNRRLAS